MAIFNSYVKLPEGKTHRVTTGVFENVRDHCTFVGLYPLGAWELLGINVANLALVGLYIFTILKWWLRSICPINMLYLNQSQSKKYPWKNVFLTQRSPWLISMKPLSTVIPKSWFIQSHQRNSVPSNLTSCNHHFAAALKLLHICLRWANIKDGR